MADRFLFRQARQANRPPPLQSGEALQTTDLVHDARPLARQLITTGDSGAPPVSKLGEFTPEVVRWFDWLGDTLKYDTHDGKYARILAVITDESVGGLPIQSPTTKRNVYGAQGTTDQDGQ